MKSLLSSLPAALVATVLCGVMYVVAQQGIRRGADEPQTAIAGELAGRLAAGMPSLPAAQVDLARSRLPFVQVYAADGSLLSSGAVLDGQLIAIPRGVLEVARKNGHNAVTWQPRPGIREAAVVVPFSGSRSGFVLAGRSLREAEDREAAVARIVGLVWLASLLFALALTVFAERIRHTSAA